MTTTSRARRCGSSELAELTDTDDAGAIALSDVSILYMND
jgi:hypothetical protein